jgi:hypothetical protein
MPFIRLRFNSNLKSDNPCFISITKTLIRFSSEFVRISKIDSDFKVLIYIDDEIRKIRFEFRKNELEDSLTLTKQKGKTNLQCSATKLYKEIDWLRSIANLSGKGRQVIPKKIGNGWEVSLMPSFENSVFRLDYNKIQKDIRGIYKYKKNDGEVVYIGKGEIVKRLSEPQRKQWDFDIIEYSEIENATDQFYWESYWIEEFKKRNNGKLPIYNVINGKKK